MSLHTLVVNLVKRDENAHSTMCLRVWLPKHRVSRFSETIATQCALYLFIRLLYFTSLVVSSNSYASFRLTICLPVVFHQ